MIILKFNAAILILFSVVTHITPIAQLYAQDKDVILILDESGSMNGDKWESVNYAMQLATALLNETDRLYIIRQDQKVVYPISLSSKQKTINEIQAFLQETTTGHNEVIQEAVNLMKKDPGRKKVVLFYGDGRWGNVRSACNDLRSSYNTIKPELYFLKVEDNTADLNGQSDFEAAMNDIDFFDVIPTNPNRSGELTSNLQDISKKIAGADRANVDFTLSGTELTFDVKFPLKKLLIVYQKDVSAAFSELEIKSLTGSQDLVQARTLDMQSGNLKGKYFEIKDKNNGLIRKGQTIKIELDQRVTKDDVVVIPVIAANLKTEFTADVVSSDLLRNEYVVCDDMESVELISFLEDISGSRINPIDGVTVTASNGSRNFTFAVKGDHAAGKINLQGDTTYISIEARYQGYFHQKDFILTVIRKKCRPAIDTTVLDLGKVPFPDFIRRPQCTFITYSINDEVVDPANYSLKIENLPFGISSSVDSSGQTFQVCLRKTAMFCDCLVPSGVLKGTLRAKPKAAGVIATVKPWTFEIIAEGNFFQRNKQCIILIISLILILTYLYGIIKKPRFDKTAKFEIHEVDRTTTYAPDNKKPRKKLPTGFAARYLIPFRPESKMVDGMKIIASTSKSTVMIARESLSEKMSKNGEPVNPKSKKDLRVFRNNTIEIEKTSTVTTVYTYRVK